MVEGLSSSDILEAHGTVHVYDKDAHDRVLHPGASDTISNHSQLELLAHIEGTLLVLDVWVILTALHLRSLVAIFSEDTIAAPTLILTICHGDSFDHIRGGNVRQHTSDRHDYSAKDRPQAHKRVWVSTGSLNET